MNYGKKEEKLIDYLQKNIILIASIILIVISILIRINLLHHKSGDYNFYLLNWFNQLKEAGGITGLGKEIGDYYILYLFILSLFTYISVAPLIPIKVISILFDFIGAFAAIYLAYELMDKNQDVQKKWIKFAILCSVLLSPNVFLNSAAWGQCDMIYSSFTLISLVYLCREEYKKAFLFFSISFVFKMQAIFIFPIYVMLWLLKKKYSSRLFLYIPIIYFLTGLPAILLGRNFASVYGIYFGQFSSNSKYLTRNFPNIYCFFPSVEEYSKIGILIAIIAIIIMSVYIIKNKWSLKNDTMIYLTCWYLFTALIFLPGMHERYSFLLCILVSVYYIVKNKKLWIAILLNIIQLFTYLSYLYGANFLDLKYYAVVQVLLYLFMTKDFILTMKESNE